MTADRKFGLRTGKILLSVNTAWNIANFRGGLIRGLQEAGHEVICAAPPDEHVRHIEALGCRFIPLAIDNKGTSPVRDLDLMRRYLALMRRERPDVFLGYTIKPNVWGSLAAQVSGIPAINNVSGLGTAFIRDTWLTRVVKQLYRTSLGRSSRVFFQNRDDEDLFRTLRLVPEGRTEVLPGSGIDLSRFAPVPMPSGRQETVFLLIARLLRDKGVVEYVEAARQVRQSWPDARFRLLGFLDVANRTAITRDEVNAWVAEGVIDYLGATGDVKPFIADADCVVLPSYREGTPRTLLEAAAMARPLIATDVPGCREPVSDGVNGYLCKVRDSAGLAAQCEKFIRLDPAARTDFGAASRAIAETRYDERIVVDRYLAAVDAALSVRRRQPARR